MAHDNGPNSRRQEEKENAADEAGDGLAARRGLPAGGVDGTPGATRFVLQHDKLAPDLRLFRHSKDRVSPGPPP